MQRRTFLQQSGILMAASTLPLSAFSIPQTSQYKMGLQLFSIRDALEKDPLGTLKIVSTLGYEDVETYGYDIEQGSYYGYKASDFKNILEDLQLSASSGHYNFSPYLEKSSDDLKRFVDACILGAKALNKNYITWPWLAPEYRTLEKFKLLSERLNIIGAQVTDAGLGFAYHNHGFEFIDYNGETGYEIILRNTDASLVKLQMDIYWVKHASNLSPAEWISKQPGRYVMWHIKDMHKVSRDYTELGNGSIDYTTILPEAERAGLQYYYLEQGGNFAKNSMQSITDSAAYFKKHLKKYL